MSPAIVTLIGWTAPAPRPCTARNAISAGMLQAKPHRIEPSRKSPMPNSMIGLRPNRSDSLPYTGTETAWASRYTENSQGNWENPPRSATIEGTAVATMVESSATREVASISEIRIGPRSERKPTAPARCDEAADVMHLLLSAGGLSAGGRILVVAQAKRYLRQFSAAPSWQHSPRPVSCPPPPSKG